MRTTNYFNQNPMDIEVGIIDNETVIMPPRRLLLHEFCKYMYIHPENLTVGEYARVHGDDWNTYFRSPESVYKYFTDTVKAHPYPEDDKELTRLIVMAMIRLIESFGHIKLGKLLRAIAKDRFAIKSKYRYHYM